MATVTLAIDALLSVSTALLEQATSLFLAHEVQELGRQVDIVRSRQEHWKSTAQKYGLQNNENLQQFVGDTTASLRVQERGLEGFCMSCCCNYYSRRESGEAAEASINAIKEFIAQFEGALESLKRDEEVEAIHEEQKKHRCFKLPFPLNKRYVPLEETIRKVRQALETEVEASSHIQVVLLCGEQASGKTELAKYLAVRYQEAEHPLPTEAQGLDQFLQTTDDAQDLHDAEQSGQTPRRATEASTCFGRFSGVAQPAKVLQGQGVRGGEGRNDQISENRSQNAQEVELPFSRIFRNGVIFIECGHDIPVKDAQLGLLQEMNFKGIPVGEIEQNTTALMKELRKNIDGLEVLVILDDVPNQEFLRELLVPGKRVKYLVTCLEGTMWADYTTVKIEKLDGKHAKQILAKHTFNNCEIPQHLQDVAHQIIEASDNHPLSIANLAMVIDRARLAELRVWEYVRDNMLKRLARQDENAYSRPHGCSGSIAASMQLAMESVTPGARKLFVAIAVFEGPCIPEVIVDLLMRCTQVDGAEDHDESSFIEWRDYLEARELIKTKRRSVPWSNGLQTMLSMHKFRRYFTRKSMMDEMSAIMSTLLERLTRKETDVTLVAALVAVYGGTTFASKAAKGLKRLDEWKNVDLTVRSLSTEPIISLLQVEKAAAHARQVIVGWLCRGHAMKGIPKLLHLPEAALATSWALCFSMPTTCLYVQRGVLRALLDLCEWEPLAAVRALRRFAATGTKETRVWFQKDHRAMSQFMNLFKDGIDEDVKVEAIWVLRYVDYKQMNRVELSAASATERMLRQRGYANAELGLYQQAFEDLVRADEVVGTKTAFRRSWEKYTKAISRVLLGDYTSALREMDEVVSVKPNVTFYLQERGAMKRLKGDLAGAAKDLELCLEIDKGETLDVVRKLKVRLEDLTKNASKAHYERAQVTTINHSGPLQIKTIKTTYLKSRSMSVGTQASASLHVDYLTSLAELCLALPNEVLTPVDPKLFAEFRMSLVSAEDLARYSVICQL